MAEPSSLGPYELVARLGSGGMAEVWKATASGPGGFARTVVLKRILPHLADDQRFAEMFLSEARLSARLHHANIVDVFACGELDGRYYLAMEFVHGHDLHRLMRAHAAEGAPDPGLGAFVAREICRALAYAHALTDDDGRPLGLVHRDVSLSNAMVSYDGAVKLLDFGIAKALGELRDAETRVSSLEGKRGYLAPEVLAGRAGDARADQYSAGVVLYELLTGTRLFARWDPRKPRPEPKAPSSVNPRVPPELDAICLRALAADRERRFASCEEMAVELDRAAHQLAWGPQQVAALLERLLPDTRPIAAEPPPTESLSVAPPVEARAQGGGVEPPTQQYFRKPRPRRVWLAGAASALGLAGALAWGIARCGAPSPVAEIPPLPTHDAGRALFVTPLHPTPPPSPPPAPRPLTTARPHPKSTKHSPSTRTDLLKGNVLDPFPK